MLSKSIYAVANGKSNKDFTPIVFKAKSQSSYKGHLLHEALLTVLLRSPQVKQA